MTDQKNRTDRSSKELRRQHNLDLMRRMRGGESLNAYDSKASWFPPRPVIKKDEKEVSRVYDVPVEAVKKAKEPVVAKKTESSNVVKFVPAAKGNRHFDEAG
jgi:hypothetical protein